MIDSYLAIANSPLLWVFLIMVAAAFGIMWLTSLEVEPKRYEAGWLRKNYIGLVIAVAALVAVSAIYFYLFGIGVSLSGLVDRLRMAAIDEDTTAEDIRHLGTTVALLMGVLAAAATIIFSIIRVWINERTAATAEKGLITDRINKAVEGLGTTRTLYLDIKTAKEEGTEQVRTEAVTAPNTEVRMGALLALETIAKDSPADRDRLVDLLCAYLIENCSHIMPFGKPENVSMMRGDIKISFGVLANLILITHKIFEPYRETKIDLRGIRIRKTRAINLTVREALLNMADFSGSNFHNCNFFRCVFRAVDARKTTFNTTAFQNCLFRSGDKIQGAKFFNCSFKGSAFRQFNLKNTNVKLDLLENTFGDSSVSLKNGVDKDHPDWPKHWSKEKLDWEEFNTQWRAFQRSIGQDRDNPT
ncbi:pentapeptide repeat-containing protein [Sulfitobacter sp.]|uniref:pentapeptide repeat-containing protein n=1 Tax=Sulfitobacter sp. TaxID=1903071 RepID=UPI0039E27C9B